MSRGFFCKTVLAALIVLAFGATAFAAPVAKVSAFPNGEGLEEFLSNLDRSRITSVKRANNFDDTAILVVPLLENCSVEVYGAEMNENFEVIPNYGEQICEGNKGYGLLFWRVVPEGMPNTVVVVKDAKGKEHFWSPAINGIDGSLVTNDEFIPFGEPGKSGAESNLMRLTINGRNVNLRAKPDVGGSAIRRASSPESFIGEEKTVKDSSGEEWRKIVYSLNEVNDCVHGIEMYVSAKYSTAGKLDAQASRQVRDYEAEKSAFGALNKWEDVFGEHGNFGTFAWTDARVYMEPNPGSRVVGILPKSPEGRDADNPDVFISGWRAYEDSTGRTGIVQHLVARGKAYKRLGRRTGARCDELGPSIRILRESNEDVHVA